MDGKSLDKEHNIEKVEKKEFFIPKKNSKLTEKVKSSLEIVQEEVEEEEILTPKRPSCHEEAASKDEAERSLEIEEIEVLLTPGCSSCQGELHQLLKQWQPGLGVSRASERRLINCSDCSDEDVLVFGRRILFQILRSSI